MARNKPADGVPRRRKRIKGIGPFTLIFIAAALGTAAWWAGFYAQEAFNMTAEDLLGVSSMRPSTTPPPGPPAPVNYN